MVLFNRVCFYNKKDILNFLKNGLFSQIFIVNNNETNFSFTILFKNNN